ncbi:MAG: glycosyltransferase family 4 protein [Candidatus Limivicinus sp.]|nr:glycosyltransferase family 4 protein [Candidatus Limivicinus sp.]
MKILCLTNIPSPYRIDFFSKLGERADVTVLYERMTASDRDSRWEKRDGSSYRAEYIPSIPVGTDRGIAVGHLKYLKDPSYDIIAIMGYSTPVQISAITYCVAHKIPYVLVIDGAAPRNDFNSWTGKLKRFLISHAAASLCTGKLSREYLQGYGASSEKIYLVPFTSMNEADVLRRLPAKEEVLALREKLGFSGNFIFLSVGQFIHRKGFDVLIKAAALLPKEIEIYIIGGTPPRAYLDLRKETGAENVRFVDFMIKEKLSEYYQAADAFVMPTREDIWGLVVNEAMAFGLPVVSTETCGAAVELVKEENGILVPSESPEALAEAMKSIAGMDEAAYLAMAEANLQLSRKTTIGAMADAYIQAFEKILENREG